MTPREQEIQEGKVLIQSICDKYKIGLGLQIIDLAPKEVDNKIRRFEGDKAVAETETVDSQPEEPKEQSNAN